MKNLLWGCRPSNIPKGLRVILRFLRDLEAKGDIPTDWILTSEHLCENLQRQLQSPGCTSPDVRDFNLIYFDESKTDEEDEAIQKAVYAAIGSLTAHDAELESDEFKVHNAARSKAWFVEIENIPRFYYVDEKLNHRPIHSSMDALLWAQDRKNVLGVRVDRGIYMDDNIAYPLQALHIFVPSRLRA